MPIYEYKCEGCSAVFEVFQKISDPPPERHDCGCTKVTRLLSNTSFVLKGTGWYATDYASKGTSGAHGSKRDASKESKDKSDSKESASKDGDKSSSKSEDKGQKAQAPTSSASPSPAPPSGTGGGGAAAA